jgi:hypothetical protein
MWFVGLHDFSRRIGTKNACLPTRFVKRHCRFSIEALAIGYNQQQDHWIEIVS